jgi:hypothetical protein
MGKIVGPALAQHFAAPGTQVGLGEAVLTTGAGRGEVRLRPFVPPEWRAMR